MSLWNFLGGFAAFNLICDLFSSKPAPLPPEPEPYFRLRRCFEDTVTPAAGADCAPDTDTLHQDIDELEEELESHYISTGGSCSPQDRIEELQDRIDELQDSLDGLEDELDGHDILSDRYWDTQDRIDELRDKIDELQDSLDDMEDAQLLDGTDWD